MGFIGNANLIPQILMKISSSNFLGASSALAKFGENIWSFAQTVIGFIMELLYFVCKWAMYFVDIIFFYIKQLAGMEMDTTSLETMVSADSDIVFNMMINNSDVYTSIIKALIGLALLLIIVFSIVAIAKNMLQSLNKNSPADVTGVMRSSFKSILLLIITPIIVIISIISSNLLLNALYNATNVSGASSLSANIFSVSSTSANLYREYAQEAKRVPITFDFSQQEEILNFYKNNDGVNQELKDYLKSGQNIVYATYQMFEDKNYHSYFSLDYTNAINEDNYNLYHMSYDSNFENKFLPEYRRIRSFKEEYYVMADIVDYAVVSLTPMYIKTIEEVFKSRFEIAHTPTAESLTNELAGVYDVGFYTESDLVNPKNNNTSVTAYDVMSTGNWDVIRYYSNYYSVDESGERGARKQIEYNHVRNSYDEVDGSVYVMCVEKTVEVSGVTYKYFEPITKGYRGESTRPFSSDYIERNQMIAAKGIFDANKRPTAIRTVKELRDTNVAGVQNVFYKVIFYRDNLTMITEGNYGDVLNTDYTQEEPEEEEEEEPEEEAPAEGEDEGGFFKKAGKAIVSTAKKVGSAIKNAATKVIGFFKSLFDPTRWLPTINFTPDKIVQTYTKETVKVGELGDAKLHIGYMFSDKLTSGISGNTYGLKFHTLFNSLEMNYFVLVLGTFLLFKMCFYVVFALIKRAFDLVLIIMVYPTVCATMPVDEGSGYSMWFGKFLAKLFSTYGTILGINFVLMLFPVIETIEFFSVDDIATNKFVARIGGAFLSLINVGFEVQTRLLNLAVIVLFELVALSLLTSGGKKAPGINDMISQIVSGKNAEDMMESNPGALMIDKLKDVGHAIGWVVAATKSATGVFSLLTQKGRDDFKQKIKEKKPFGALQKAAEDKMQLMQLNAQKNQAKKELKDTLNDPNATADDVKAKMAAVSQAQKNIYTPPAKKNGQAGGFFAQQMQNAQKQGAGFGQGKKKKK